MIEIKSKRGTQIVEVSDTGAGIKIKCVEVRTHRSFVVHIFCESVPELIKALQTLTKPKSATIQEIYQKTG